MFYVIFSDPNLRPWNTPKAIQNKNQNKNEEIIIVESFKKISEI